MRGETLTGVLVDACGWVAVVDARINIDLELEPQIGPVEIKVTDLVLEELNRLAERESRPLLLDLHKTEAKWFQVMENIPMMSCSIWPLRMVGRY